MKIVEIAEAQATLAEYASDLTEELVIITSNGQPIAALVTLENVDMETISLTTNAKFIELIEQSRARRRSEGGFKLVSLRSRSVPSASQLGLQIHWGLVDRLKDKQGLSNGAGFDP